MPTIHHLLSARFALWGLAAVLAIFGVGNLFVAVFFSAKHELIYQFSVTVSHCVGEKCAYSATLEVANSGSEMQEQVMIKLTGLPERMGGMPRTLNLDSSRPRSGDPVIRQNHSGKVLEIHLGNFSPGALTQFNFSGFISLEDVESAAQPELEIQGRGRMIEADPRGIAFFRWFT